MRPLIISSLADIAFAISEHFVIYFNDFYNVFCAAADVAIPPGETNEDHIDYVITLREAVLDAIPPVILSMCAADKQADFINCLNKVVPYMQCLWADTNYRTVSIVNSLVGLTGFVEFKMLFVSITLFLIFDLFL